MNIRSTGELLTRYNELSPQDRVIATVAHKHLKTIILVDLLERGVRCYPSPLAQILHSSKSGQALVLKSWMLPQTRVIARRADLMAAIGHYAKEGIGAVVTKAEHVHCGYGVQYWTDMETLYNHVGRSEEAYPFVLQPYLRDFRDVRVIILGHYVEAYARENPYNFRSNLAAGGSSRPFELDADREKFCRNAMARGRFPYAHMDLQLLADGSCHLAEISLDGGIKGARITRRDLDRRKKTLLEELAAGAAAGHSQ